MPAYVMMSLAGIAAVVVGLIIFLIAVKANDGDVPPWYVSIGILVVTVAGGWFGYGFVQSFMADRKTTQIVETLRADPQFAALEQVGGTSWKEAVAAVDGTRNLPQDEREDAAKSAVRVVLVREVTARIPTMPDRLVPQYANMLAALIENDPATKAPAPAAGSPAAPAAPAAAKKDALPSLSDGDKSKATPTPSPTPTAASAAAAPAADKSCLDALTDPAAPSTLTGVDAIEAKGFFVSLLRTEPDFSGRAATPASVSADLKAAMPKAAELEKMSADDYASAIEPGPMTGLKCKLTAGLYRVIGLLPAKQSSRLLRGLAGGRMGY